MTAEPANPPATTPPDEGLRPYETPPLTAEQRRRLRRTGITFIVIAIVLELAVGIGSLGDLHRLSTPRGVAKLWVQAAASRDCDALFDLMLSSPPSDRAGRPAVTYCDEQNDRYKGAVVSAVADRVLPDGPIPDVAVIDVTQHGAAHAAAVVEIVLRHTHGRWHVVHEGDRTH
ncbi:MAG TPA: hypothetical protein VHE83_09090 [Mycobacteriales bacterium]|nr:hypothetical protein [Mycobacteriales bacterium]